MGKLNVGDNTVKLSANYEQENDSSKIFRSDNKKLEVKLLLPELAVAIGLKEALFVQQLHYWLLRSKNRREGLLWVYKTHRQWLTELPFLSERTIRRITKSLRKQGIIRGSEYNKMPGDRTLWYTISYDHPDLKRCGWTDSLARIPGRKGSRTRMVGKTAEMADSASQNGRFQKAEAAGSETVKVAGCDHSILPRELTIDSRHHAHPRHPEDDEISFSADEKTKRQRVDEQEGESLESCSKSSGKRCTLPRELSEEELEHLYPRSVPDAIDLSRRCLNERRANLQRITFPFRCAIDLKDKLGSNFDEPLESWFEDQVEGFIKKVLYCHWSKFHKEHGGMSIRLSRACRVGAMYRFGFRPKTPEQMEAEKRERERRLKRQRQEERAREEQERLERERNQKIIKFINNEHVKRYLLLAGIISKNGAKDRVQRVSKWLYDIKEGHGNMTLSDLTGWCKHEGRKLRRAQVRQERLKMLDKAIRENDQVYAYFIRHELLSVDQERVLFLNDDIEPCLDHLEGINQELQIDDFDVVVDLVAKQDEQIKRRTSKGMESQESE